jgi:hypothetical protein
MLKGSDQPQWVEVFRIEKVNFSEGPREGRFRAEGVEGKWLKESYPIVHGTLFVPIRQPQSRLVMQLLEPQSPDSWLAWGSFHSIFEKKEYMEDYIAEQVAEKLFKEQPFLKTEFEAKVASDPDFAKNPEARLEFFHRLHPSWDFRFRLYPVFRN